MWKKRKNDWWKFHIRTEKHVNDIWKFLSRLRRCFILFYLNKVEFELIKNLKIWLIITATFYFFVSIQFSVVRQAQSFMATRHKNKQTHWHQYSKWWRHDLTIFSYQEIKQNFQSYWIVSLTVGYRKWQITHIAYDKKVKYV